MTRRMRIIVSLMFIIIIVLAMAITRFYSAPDEKKSVGASKADIAKLIRSDENGNQIFADKDGYYGIIDSNDRVTAAPEWLEMSFAGGDKCIVSKRIGGKLMTGCIDYEGNIVVPLVFRNITKKSVSGITFYTADSASDNSCVLYNEQFEPLFRRSWNSSSLSGDEITLADDFVNYRYSVGESGFELENAVFSGNVLDCPYSLEIRSRLLLEKLTPDMMEEMLRIAERYILYAFTGSGEYLTNVRSVNHSGFETLFPNEKNILSKKLKEIKSIYIYSVRSDDELPHFAVAVVTSTELVYADDNDKPRNLTERCKAVVEFRGGSFNELETISAGFDKKQPDYPKNEAELFMEEQLQPQENSPDYSYEFQDSGYEYYSE